MHTKHRIDAETKEERKQEHFSLEKIKVAGEEASKSMLEMIETLFTHLIQGLGYIVSEEDGRHQAFMFVAAASILALSISMSKEAIELIFYLLIRSLSMPRLVREWGRASDNGFYRRQIKSNLLKDVVLREKDKKQIEDICNIVDIGRKRNAPLRNILLHGSVGTGKSITARAIAEASNLPYAIMSGADIAPLGHQGPSELRRLLAWASGKKNGGILVIDEAESALGKRLRETDASSKANEKESQANDASSSARDALNIFLGMTGETGGKLMLILTTSNPSALDSAVLDRCDHVICCSMPSSEERKEIIKRELEKRFKKQPLQCKGFGVRKLIMKPKEILSYGDDFDLSNATNHLSDDKMTGGFSGRELSTIIRALETAAYSDRCVLTMEIFNRVESEICSSIRTKKALKSCG
jgi:ATPase family AAA domain-containing protein 3A/B